MTALAKEARFAVRSLARQPLATAIILLTLALGLGTNAATFGMTDRLLLRPFQIPNVDRLVMIAEGSATMISPQETVAPANFVEWRTGSSALRSMSAFVYWDVNLSGGDRPERVQGYQVTADFFTVLGVGPALGRTLDASDEVWGRHHQVVISDSLWHRRFGGDAGIVGRAIRLDGETRTIVGVAPRGFDFPFGTEVWAPLALNPEAAQNRVAHYLSVIAALPPRGRHRPGAGRDGDNLRTPEGGSPGCHPRTSDAGHALHRWHGRCRAADRAGAVARRGRRAAAHRLHEHRGAAHRARGRAAE